MKRLLVTGVIFIVSVMLIYAQEFITGTGTLTAEGDGIVALSGSGEMTIEGEGKLFIVDRTLITTIDITTSRRTHIQQSQSRGNNIFVYERFHGTAHIQGDDFAVIMDGINITVSVSGTSTILLEGEGEYTLENISSTWSDDGVMIELSQIEDDTQQP